MANSAAGHGASTAEPSPAVPDGPANASEQGQTTPMEGLLTTAADALQSEAARSITSAGQPELPSAKSAPMSTDTTPPASQQQAGTSHDIQPPEATAASGTLKSHAAVSHNAWPSLTHSQQTMGDAQQPNSGSNSAPQDAAAGSAAQVLTSEAHSSSVDLSAQGPGTSPTLTGTTSRSTTSPDLAMSQIGRPRQHSLHQSDDTNSATTPASNSDDGTVHTSETSSGKSKALSQDHATGSLLQKLPLPVLDRIIDVVRYSFPFNTIPCAVREELNAVPFNVRIILWFMQAWGVQWLFPLRMVSSNFNKAVRKSDYWPEFLGALSHVRRERLDGSNMPAMYLALRLQREYCFACCLNGARLDVRAILNPQFATTLGRFVPICEIHEACLVAPEENILLCSNCFLDDRRYIMERLPNGSDVCRLRDDVEITFVEDDERFPQAENVCSSCRRDAFFAALSSEDPNCRRWFPGLRRTMAWTTYVWQGEGSATEAAKGAIEQLWLETMTEYPTMTKNLQLQKRMERLKRVEAVREERRKQRGLLKTLVDTDNMDSASDLSIEDDYKSDESIHFEDEDNDGNIFLSIPEDRWLRDRAWHDWCRQRLENGWWKSAHDQQDAEVPIRNPSGSQLPRLLLHGAATKPTEEPNECPPPVLSDAPLLPPAALFHKACRMWDEIAVPEFFKLPMANVVEMLKTREDGFELSLEMDFARLFSWLRKPQAWALPAPPPHQQPQALSGTNTTALASRFHQPPFVPNAPADVGPGTVARIMEIWKRACAPLGECDCGICRRQKRKRSHDESDATNPPIVPSSTVPATTMPAPALPTDAAAAAAIAAHAASPEGDDDENAQEPQEQGAVDMNIDRAAGATPVPAPVQQHQMIQRDEQVDATEGPRKAARVEISSQAT